MVILLNLTYKLDVSLTGIFMCLTRYDGHIVAKLPFHPHPFFQKMSHRGIAGNDPTDCSMVRILLADVQFDPVRDLNLITCCLLLC
jgi:hypothetical protein